MNSKQNQLNIGEAAKILGVSIETLRRWDNAGKLPAIKTPGGQRRYTLEALENQMKIDLFGRAKIWVLKEHANEPNKLFYCRTRDVLEARVRKIDHELVRIESLKKIFSLISSSAGEIGNNSFDHNLGNWTDIPGVFFGYDLKMGKIVLADRGQGILKTLQRVRPELSNHEQALKVAFTEVVTGRAPELRGNGLKYVRQNVESGYFSLTFQTGNAMLSLKAGESLLDDTKINKTKDNINGCLALIEFKL